MPTGGGYGAGRDGEQLARLDEAIERFATLYEADISPQPKTIFLFPGGMGSQLMRARRPYNQPPFSYYTAWLACNIVFGEARNLQLSPGGVDHDSTYVVPDGGVDFVKLHPYVDFVRWCGANWVHLFIFGWDWRRGIQDSADFFLQTFMPRFAARFTEAPDPLDDFSLVGHSAGGMVVKAIVNQAANPYVQRMKRAITVAAPFYGYGGQIHRFFKGDSDINWTLGGLDSGSAMASIISSMPGGYEFLYLDRAVYDANATGFANDPEGYNLASYPSMDKVNPGQSADPYNPLPDGTGKVRYPVNYGFNMSMLHDGLAASRKVSMPLRDDVAAKFYNIRGVQAKNGVRLQGTVVSSRWACVPPQFDADHDPDPITDSLGFGDGTQPAWTTRLLGLPNPAQQVITIVDDIEHMTMMNAPSVHREIAALLGLDPATAAFVEQTEVIMATRDDLNRFLDGLRRQVMVEDITDVERRRITINYLREYRTDDLHALFARAYVDALKSPSQKIGRPPEPKAGEGTPERRPRRGRPPSGKRR
jgi:pimeloyl-ACP methyl ester carboxylesterase